MAKFIIRDGMTCRFAKNYISGLDESKVWEMTIAEAGSARSLAQNNLYWKWMTDLAKQITEKCGATINKDHMDIYFKKEFLPYSRDKIGGQIVEVLTGTSKLGVKKFTAYLNEIEADAIPKGYTLPFPEDIYAEAMGKS